MIFGKRIIQKCFTARFFTVGTSKIQFPKESFRKIIRSSFLLWIAEILRNLTLRSFQISQLILDLRAQNSFSWERIISNPLDKERWRLNIKELRLIDKAFWTPKILASNYFFLRKIFQNSHLFQSITLGVKVAVALSRLSPKSCQASETTLYIPGWGNQMVNLMQKGSIFWVRFQVKDQAK